jgi:hypothetical protein
VIQIDEDVNNTILVVILILVGGGVAGGAVMKIKLRISASIVDIIQRNH